MSVKNHLCTSKIKRKDSLFIADFYCAEKKSVIEVDGSIHKYTQYYDYQRDLVLTKHDLSTLRIKNQELDDIATVKSKILNFLER